MAIRSLGADHVAHQVQRECRQGQSRHQQLALRDQGEHHRADHRCGQIVGETVMVFREPFERLFGVGRRQLHDDAQPIHIWRQSGDGDQRAIATRGDAGRLSDHPAEQTVGDRTHRPVMVRCAYKRSASARSAGVFTPSTEATSSVVTNSTGRPSFTSIATTSVR